MTDLLDATRAGGDVDVIRKGVELVLQALIDTEATELIGAERYERAASRPSMWSAAGSRTPPCLPAATTGSPPT